MLQGILYVEDALGVRLTEKERQIAVLEGERRTLNQELSATERELHALQASSSIKDQEKRFLEQQLSRHQAELRMREEDIAALRVSHFPRTQTHTFTHTHSEQDSLHRQAADQTLQMERELSVARGEIEELNREKWAWQQEQVTVT